MGCRGENEWEGRRGRGERRGVGKENKDTSRRRNGARGERRGGEKRARARGEREEGERRARGAAIKKTKTGGEGGVRGGGEQVPAISNTVTGSTGSQS